MNKKFIQNSFHSFKLHVCWLFEDFYSKLVVINLAACKAVRPQLDLTLLISCQRMKLITV